MNKKEVLDIIHLIENTYNHPFTKNVIPSEQKNKIKNIVEAWHEFLVDQDFNQVRTKVKKHIFTSKFPPTIADLYEEPSESKVNHEHLEYMRKLRSGSRD
ncbi:MULTISPECIES: replicative helicase loader/inhibitor [unclassified Sutcliffiella]|uniref:replicative helicase loader/inhibitor n=1 Tax=unclassified Sutcliffiella TaxID=2837532 RepID=UPI0030D5A82D